MTTKTQTTTTENELLLETKEYEKCAVISTIEPDEREQIDSLVEKILSRQTSGAGRTNLIENRIRLKSDEPVRCKPRRMSKHIREAAQRIVDEWKLAIIIEPLTSDYSSAPVIVRKSDDTYRMCIDYRDVNAKTIKDRAPSLDSILDGLRGARYISKIDLKQAFLQVSMEESSKKYTAFAVNRSGLWQFKQMPFGLTGSPATFCQLVNSLFGPTDQPQVFAYLDDILIVTQTFDEHLKWLE